MAKKNYRPKSRFKKEKKQNFQVSMIALMLTSFMISFFTIQGQRESIKKVAGNQTILFLSKAAKPAQFIAQKNDLYTSVMLAQAVLESNNGQSQLSQKPYYNFFGIKGAYNGKAIILPTNEDDGKGNFYKVDAKFRHYGTRTNGFKDYAQVLSDPLYLRTHKSHTQTYEEATQVLTGHYATDTNYNQKLNHIISTYQLTLFDYPF
ncbi:glycoside hydrolase family 73 protein [Streptococcus pseudoporcinus]|uniref:Mannosyl-glycoprotein endo-beta-N-acetylglucosaminidase family protein n=1 Tax=Streptococcus pseudoporcinus TaxID=361101 RepID=A0A4U9XLI4_9STRE|nr:glycoside hydrolase family 73 protein [Streptococcus pseudoporcinus]VTS13896.1 mannosyl-glycoprotein endo-beta-N-acetylglucosaminidase family protein [Streptococcus pseudoporcinus]VUC66866.1 mannosyl-glycoprotein endo-beta-N-acetylglucosaminidase family protein [Streptococcus pseudoporcinus]VUC97794.1 mannosyl-glycoprotein endo-beta-N-acetylglucosaminidase family protein [Streptococcus pseudoporcinus]VUC98186.1 mannosyl-glycoprotein endo-beta-N-acetylglucosaminidase family protein [Streptoco